MLKHKNHRGEMNIHCGKVHEVEYHLTTECDIKYIYCKP